MGFLGDVLFNIGMALDTAKSFGELAINAKEELKEIVNETEEEFVHEVIKNEVGYKSSYKKRDEAAEMISESKMKLREHCNTVNSKIEKLNQEVNKVYEQKKRLAQKLNVLFNEQEDKFGNVTREVINPSFHYTEPMIDLGRMLPIICTSTCSFNAFKSFGFVGPASLIAMPLLNGIARNARIEAANEYYEAAKDYKVQVNREIAELDRIASIIRHVEIVLKEEEYVIQNLLYTPISKEKVNDYAKQLRILMSEMVLSDQGTLNLEYKKAVSTLKNYL